MALPSVISAPSAFGFSKNSLPFAIKCEKFQTSPGVKFEGIITFNTSWLGNKSLVFSFGGNTVAFNTGLLIGVDEAGNNFPPKSFGISWPDFTTAVMAAFNRNYYLSSAFIFTVLQSDTQTRIKFTARQVGTNYNILITTTIPGCTFATTTAGVNPVYNSNYKLYAELYASLSETGNDDTFTKLVSMEVDAVFSVDKFLAKLDAAEVLNDFLKIQAPDVSVNLAQIITTQASRYFIKFAEAFGNPPSKQALVRSSTYRAFKGGLAKRFFTYLKSYKDYAKVQTRYLTWAPLDRETDKIAPQFIHAFNPEAHPTPGQNFTFAVRVKTYYKGIQQEPAFNPYPAVQIPQYKSASFPSGFRQLSLHNKAYEIDKYTVQVYIPAQEITDPIELSLPDINFQTVTYNIDSQAHFYSRYLLYSNSLGGFDTLWLTGATAYTSSPTQGEADVTPDPFATIPQPEAITFAKREAEKFVTRTGYKDLEEIERLRELLLSEEVYLVTGTTKVLINVQADDQPIFDELENLYRLSISYSLPFSNTAYSKS